MLETETVVVEAVAGDFNADNMSPADIEYNRHPLFDTYKDVCMKKPGEERLENKDDETTT